MKDEHLINFGLFCSRKKFSLYSFLLRNKEVSYEDILEYFRSKNVTPPDRDLFDKTRQKVLIELSPKILPLAEEPKKAKEVKKTTENKPKRKSRRRKNEQGWVDWFLFLR